jgi:hypothetical protein
MECGLQHPGRDLSRVEEENSRRAAAAAQHLTREKHIFPTPGPGQQAKALHTNHWIIIKGRRWVQLEASIL